MFPSVLNIGSLCTSNFFSFWWKCHYLFVSLNSTSLSWKRYPCISCRGSAVQEEGIDYIFNRPIGTITKQRWSCKVQCKYAGSLLCSLRVVSLCIIEACWKSSSALESTLSAWDFFWNWTTANFRQILEPNVQWRTFQHSCMCHKPHLYQEHTAGHF